MGRVEERELFLFTGRSIDLLKSTVPESVINAKIKVPPKQHYNQVCMSLLP